MPTTLIALIVYLLATHRLTRIVTTDKITVRVRDFIRDHGYKTRTGRSISGAETTEVTIINRVWAWLHDLITCAWCSSVWIGAVVVALQHYQQSWFQYVCFALSLSSVAGMLSDKF